MCTTNFDKGNIRNISYVYLLCQHKQYTKEKFGFKIESVLVYQGSLELLSNVT